jgi:anti-sigma28 factor (negative regulator of flagellin synthesis)
MQGSRSATDWRRRSNPGQAYPGQAYPSRQTVRETGTTSDAADREEGEVAQAKVARLKDKIAALKQQMQQYRDMEKAVQARHDQQISLTDPAARSMAASGKGTGVVGYNVQTAVDAKHHLIVAHEVTNVGHDCGSARK